MKYFIFILCMLFVIVGIFPVKAQSGWVQTQINPGFGYSLHETDSIIFASTMDGVFSTTGDGMPWFSIGLANHTVYDVFDTGNSILAATTDGIFRSTDKGNTWELINGSPVCSGVGGTQGHTVFAKNGTYIFAHMWAQGLFRSDDDGITWDILSVGTHAGMGGDIGGWATCIYSFGGKIFIGLSLDDNIGIYYSQDNGYTWIPANSTNFYPFENILFFYAHDDILYAGGFMGLHQSTDSGVNWVSQYRNVINSDGQMTGLGIFRDVVSYNQNLVAAVDAHSLQISQDGGKNWTDFNTGLITDWTFVDLAIKPPYIWALTGGFGNAYRRLLTEIVTSVKPQSISVSTDLLEQNYPNPCESFTKISYTIINYERVEITVFDVYGKKVATLVNKSLSPGTYESLVDTHNLESGTYFYRLNTTNYAETRKFLVHRIQ